MRRSLLALSLVFVMTALPAYAHAPRPGPNGGLKVDAGANHHVELVATGTTEVTVYLFDAGVYGGKHRVDGGGGFPEVIRRRHGGCGGTQELGARQFDGVGIGR